MAYIKFATIADVEEYKGSSLAADNAPFLLNRANELVYFAVCYNYDANNPHHVLAAKNAVCCQVLQWLETNASPVDGGRQASFSLGDLSITNSSEASHDSTALCPMSVRYLRHAGLTYKGLRNHYRGPQKV